MAFPRGVSLVILTGEITIIDSRPSLASVEPGGALKIEKSFDADAAFPVWAAVKDWEQETLPASLRISLTLQPI